MTGAMAASNTSAMEESMLHDTHEVLERLAMETGETAALAVRRNGGLSYVDEVVPSAVVAPRWGTQPNGRNLSLPR